jgi:GMP synthase PP-ATPase subunit
MPKREAPKAEFFATPRDVVTAHEIVEEELGEDIDLDYMGLPKNVGVKGDSQFIGSSVIISAPDQERLDEIYADEERLMRVSNRICNETDSACRVFLDITPGGGYFEIARQPDALGEPAA